METTELKTKQLRDILAKQASMLNEITEGIYNSDIKDLMIEIPSTKGKIHALIALQVVIQMTVNVMIELNKLKVDQTIIPFDLQDIINKIYTMIETLKNNENEETSN